MNEEKYREAEARLWKFYGLQPSEQRVRLATTGTEVRVLEVGEGPEVLLVHGGPNAGSTWAPIAKQLTGFRLLMVDRPGTGLSDPWRLTADNLAGFGARFVGDVLDGLGSDKVLVIASSFGGHLALRSAAHAPERITRMVQMAAPALLPDQPFPPFMKQLQNGFLRWLIPRLPPMKGPSLDTMRQIGHGASLDAGLIPDEFFEWYLDLARYTHTMRTDMQAIGAELLPARERVTLAYELLGQVEAPTLFIWGADDGFGGEEHAKRTVAAMPHAELIMIPRSGHLPWLDDPDRVAALCVDFLRPDAARPSQAAG